MEIQVLYIISFACASLISATDSIQHTTDAFRDSGVAPHIIHGRTQQVEQLAKEFLSTDSVYSKNPQYSRYLHLSLLSLQRYEVLIEGALQDSRHRILINKLDRELNYRRNSLRRAQIESPSDEVTESEKNLIEECRKNISKYLEDHTLYWKNYSIRFANQNLARFRAARRLANPRFQIAPTIAPDSDDDRLADFVDSDSFDEAFDDEIRSESGIEISGDTRTVDIKYSPLIGYMYQSKTMLQVYQKIMYKYVDSLNTSENRRVIEKAGSAIRDWIMRVQHTRDDLVAISESDEEKELIKRRAEYDLMHIGTFASEFEDGLALLEKRRANLDKIRREQDEYRMQHSLPLKADTPTPSESGSI